MISVHDFASNIPYENYLEEFINKYKRRLEQLKDIINICEENIHFIYGIDHQFLEGYIPTIEDIKTFFEIINIINPSNKIFLHIVLPPKHYNENIDNLKINNKVFIYKLESIHKNFDFNWEIVFDNINNIN